jgi:5-methylcytosine-specific restriction protein A
MSLPRRTPLARGGPLKRTSGRPKRARDTGPTKTARDLVWERAGGRCELCGGSLAGMRGFSRHHRRPRRMGGSRLPDTNSAANILLVCGSATSPDGCHHRIESNRTQAYAEGLLLHADQDPAEIPVLINNPTRSAWPQLVWLTADGTYSEEPPA